MTDASSGRPSAVGRRRRWLPPALWALAILVATSWPNPNVPQVGRGDLVVHALLYGGLGLLAARAALVDFRHAGRTALLVAVATSAFGAVDEWHQRFVPGRSASVDDWAADTLGGGLGALVALARRARRARPA